MPALIKTRPEAPRGAESLGKAMELILHRSGVMSPQRAAELERIRARQAQRTLRHAAEAYVRGSGVWPRYESASLDDLSFPRAVLGDGDFAKYERVRDELRALLDGEPGMLVLCGGNGPGKTHLASALVLAFCRRGLESRFTTANDFFLALKSTFGERGRTQEDVVQRFRRYELLVIDEIEVRSDSNWENQQLRDLINVRYSCVLSTVILTNKTPDEINGTSGTPYFSTAVRDRIRQEGAILVCDWPSLRARARATAGAAVSDEHDRAHQPHC